MSAPLRVAVLDDYQDVARRSADWSVLDGRATIDVFTDHLADPEEVRRRLAPYDAVVLMRERTPLPAPVIAALPRLRLLVTTGMRNLAVDVDAATELGIVVCGTRSEASSTVEHTWALILGAARHLVTESSNVATGRWQTTVGVALRGKVLGVLGLGRIGGRVAAVGAAFGMDVVAWSSQLTDERAREAGALRVGFDDLLDRSDVVTVHLVLGERTRGLIGGPQLARMKRTALLVNTSRGPIVDTAALVAALEAGTIGAAAVDVYDEEPLPTDHPLRSAPRCLATPHLGYVTDTGYETFYGDVVADIVGFLDGRPVRRL